MVGLTVAEKMLARCSCRASVAAGDIVIVPAAFSYVHDYAAFVIDAFNSMGFSDATRPGRIAVCFDHVTPAKTIREANNMKRVREFSRAHGLGGFYEGGAGIGHQVMVEEGWIAPGSLVASIDS